MESANGDSTSHAVPPCLGHQYTLHAKVVLNGEFTGHYCVCDVGGGAGAASAFRSPCTTAGRRGSSFCIREAGGLC
jgi:hypothetical protein